MRIAHAALSDLHDDEVAAELIALLRLAATEHVASPLGALHPLGLRSSDEPPELPAALEADMKARHGLIDRLARTDVSGQELFTLALETPGLGLADDFKWLLERACDASRPMEERKRYLKFAQVSPWEQRSDNVDAWLAVRDVEPVKSILGCPTVVELDSAEAEQLRQEWRLTRMPRKRPKQTRLEQAPHERVLIVLESAETKDPRFFFNVCNELALDPTSTHYQYERFLARTPGWRDAETATRVRIVDAGKRLLTSDVDEPESCRERPLSSRSPGCMAGLFLVQESDPEWLAARPWEWWERWCWYILRELCPWRHGEPEEPKAALFQRLLLAAPTAVREELLRLTTDTTEGAESLLNDLLRLTGQRNVDGLDASLCRKLEANEVAPVHIAAVAQFVLARQPETARAICERLLAQDESNGDNSPASSAAVALLFECPSEAWPAVKQFMRRNNGQGRRVVGRFTHQSRLRNTDPDAPALLDRMTAAQLGEFAAVLLDLFPPENDPERDGAYFAGPDDSARDLRVSLINTLGSRDDREAVEALQRLETSHGARYPWLRRHRACVERSHRLARWDPITPGVVAEVLSSSEKRLLRSENDVLEGIVDALAAFNKAIRSDGPEDVEDLWNTPRGKAQARRRKSMSRRKSVERFGRISSSTRLQRIVRSRSGAALFRPAPAASRGRNSTYWFRFPHAAPHPAKQSVSLSRSSSRAIAR